MLYTLLVQATLACLTSAGYLKLGSPTDVPKFDPDGFQRCIEPEKVPIRTEWYGCVPKTKLDKNAKCKANWYRDCEGYCESYTWWDYGLEVPFKDTFCKKGPCSLKAGIVGKNVTLPEKKSILSIKHVSLNMRFEYLDPYLTPVSWNATKPKAQEEKCGYWAFVPYRLHSCGFAAKGEGHRFWFTSWCTDVKHDGECHTTVLRQLDDPEPDGKIVFVATECDDPHKRLPYCFQDPVYLSHGVSVDSQLREDYITASKDGNVAENWDACVRGVWPTPHLPAMSGHYNSTEDITGNLTSFRMNYGEDSFMT